MLRLYLISVASTLGWCAIACAGDQAEIVWRPWSDSIFAEAGSKHRFVLLDLGTVWCHWCPVMDEVTYANPRCDRSHPKAVHRQVDLS